MVQRLRDELFWAALSWKTWLRIYWSRLDGPVERALKDAKLKSDINNVVMVGVNDSYASCGRACEEISKDPMQR